MKRPSRELRRDLLTAARLGMLEAFEIALEAFAALPALQGNAPLPRSVIESDLLPLARDLGRALPAPMAMPAMQIMTLHPMAAVRCLSAGLIPTLWGDPGAERAAETLSRDARTEVRTCLAMALQDLPDKVRWGLIERWVQADSPKQRGLALHLLPTTSPSRALGIVSGCRSDEDHDVAEAVVDTLERLAALDPQAVLTELKRWADESGPHLTSVIARALSHHPLVSYPADAVNILASLATHAGAHVERHAIGVALRAVARKNETAAIVVTLHAWASGPDANAASIARQVLNRLEKTSE